MTLDIGIVGAGIAGLSAARVLSHAGHRVSVVDKGRGVGGRLSTRRTDWGLFDHGAQFATVRDPAFSAWIAEIHGDKAVKVWPHGSDGAMIGQPGMSALVKAGFKQLPSVAVETGVEITNIGEVAEGLVLSTTDREHLGPFDKVLVTSPAPQAQALLAAFGDPFTRLSEVEYAPSYTLMAAFDEKLPIDDVPVRKPQGNLASACRQSARRDVEEGAKDLWVVQASAEFSADHLEREREAMVPVLLRVFQDAVGESVPQPTYAAAHRWRYALVKKALNEPVLLSADGRLGVAGDGLLGPRVELAFLSGAHAGNAMG